MSFRPSNTLRLIGGTLRGRKIHFPTLPGLRPTPDRVRETVFNWLMHDVSDARVLDLFSGSGALGLEALSRGAAHVTFVEKAREALVSIEAHLQQFKIPQTRYRLYHGDVSDFLAQLPAPMDLIFLDPPFHQDWVEKTLARCQLWLSDRGKVYVEQESTLPADSRFPLLKEKVAGDVRSVLYSGLPS